MNPKIISIAAADGWFCESLEGKSSSDKIAFWALLETGVVVAALFGEDNIEPLLITPDLEQDYGKQRFVFRPEP